MAPCPRLRFVASMMPDPFGETQTPWWRRIWRRDRPDGAPKRYLIPATTIGGIAGLSLPAMHGHVTRAVIFALVTALPPSLVDMWWRQRRRRVAEQTLVLPEWSGRSRAGDRTLS